MTTRDLTGGNPIAFDASGPDDTAKLAMFPLTAGGVRFIVMSHPENEQLAFVRPCVANSPPGLGAFATQGRFGRWCGAVQCDIRPNQA